jgi:membrane-bound lytic murein transglycosylase A
MPRSHLLVPAARLLLLPLLCLAVSACSTAEPVAAPSRVDPYLTELPPGAAALRLIIDPSRMPDLAAAYRDRDAMLMDALDESIRWFDAPSSTRSFPFRGVTHAQARASVHAMRDLLETARSAEEFRAAVSRRFDVYESVGCDNRGTVLFTGYYAPIFSASRERSGRFKVPLYRRPEDLVTDPETGTPLGRRTASGSVVPYHTRQAIETSGMFDGHELVWVEDHFAAYIIHVNGSAQLRLTDGDTLYIGYAGKTDRPYASLGEAMKSAGLLRKGEASLAGIRQAYRRAPERVHELMWTNENYVFFTEYAGGGWPAGSLGVRVTAERSLATDKSIYPRGGIVLVDTRTTTFSGDQRHFKFALDQDTGGAIRAPGRADLFMGIGPGAEILAGQQFSEGRLYYFILKAPFVGEYAVPDMTARD